MRESPGLLLGIVSQLVTQSPKKETVFSSSSLDFVVSGEELRIMPLTAFPTLGQGPENCQNWAEPCSTMPGTPTNSALLLHDTMDLVTAYANLS